MAILRKVLDAFRGVDRRQLQLEIDMHRLYLLTSYNRKKSEHSGSSADDVIAVADKLSVAERQAAVQENVHKQVLRIGQAMDTILLLDQPKGKEKVPQVSSRRSGLYAAVGAKPTISQSPEMTVPTETRPLSFSEVSAAFKTSMGYTLERKPSQVDHNEAGQGVFLDGKVGPGTVVSFYPGIIYSPSQYRHMPGFPRMDVVNSFLVSRYDGLIIDGKPWGCGGESRELWRGEGGEAVEQDLAKAPTTDGRKRSRGFWGALSGKIEQVKGARQGEILERRNPLTLAHYINHPVQGKQPNVMLCPYNFVVKEPNIRPYIPNVHFDDLEMKMRRRGLIWVHDLKAEEDSVDLQQYDDASVVRTIVLVSTKEICDEELFLNYRLSNHQQWPAWYKPVDADEDKRRWY